MKKLTAITVAFLVSALVSKVATAQQEVKGDRTNVPTITVFVQNDRVKVYEGHFKPGDKSAAMSNRPARVEFAITDGQMRNYYPDGKTEEVTWKAGDVKWSEPATYQQENIGQTEFKIRVVQLK